MHGLSLNSGRCKDILGDVLGDIICEWMRKEGLLQEQGQWRKWMWRRFE